MGEWRLFCQLLVAAQVAICFWKDVGHLGQVTTLGVLALSLIPKVRPQVSKLTHSLIVVLTAIVFLVTGFSQFINRGMLGLFMAVAEYLLLIQALELIRQPRPATTNYIPGLSVLTLSLLVMSFEEGFTPTSLGYVYVGFIVLLVLVLRPDFPLMWWGGKRERHKAEVLLMIFGGAIAAGALFQQELRQDLPQLRQMIKQLQVSGEEIEERSNFTSGTRLVDRVGLGSIAETQLANPNDVAFTVVTANTPGYMRTAAFVRFDGKQWQNPWNIRRRPAEAFVAFGSVSVELPNRLRDFSTLRKDKQFFPFPGGSQGSMEKMVVRVPDGRGSLIPIPHHTAYLIGTPGNRVQRPLLDPHQSVVPNGFDNRNYGLLVSESQTVRVDPAYLSSLLEIPEMDAEFLRNLGEKVLQGKTETSQRVRAVEGYFQNNFSYSLRSNLENNLQGRSPLRAFLEDRREAHCEYFATASALLLRSQGIPCRLAAGYLVYEKNDDDDYFVAANRNAHAWVEAYDSEANKWIVVEATPSIKEYIARFSTASDQRSALEAGNATGDNSLGLLSLFQLSWSIVGGWWRGILAGRFAWLLPLLFGSLFVAYRYRLLRIRYQQRTRDWVSPEVRKADQLAQRLGFQRAAHETCDRFASRLTEANPALVPLANWYREYAARRYQLIAQEPQPLPSLRQLKDGLKSER